MLTLTKQNTSILTSMIHKEWYVRTLEDFCMATIYGSVILYCIYQAAGFFSNKHCTLNTRLQLKPYYISTVQFNSVVVQLELWHASGNVSA